MNDKGIGAVFCGIAAMLLSAKYIAAAIFLSGVQSWNWNLFQAGLSYVGATLDIASAGSLLVGILFLGYGVYRDVREKKK